MTLAAVPHQIQTRVVSPATETVVKLAGLGKRFPVRRSWKETVLHPRSTRYVEVLHDISCEVRQGEFFGVLGPNGAGKTTLFKILSTLVLPDRGSATIAGADVVRDAERVRALLAPVITDERSLNWRLSARENLRFYASLHGLRGSVLRNRVDDLLHVVELNDAGDKLVGQFSSGMKQRLLIARALLSRPRVLLLDEPTRSLDPLSARRFRAFLREDILVKQECTVLLATHNSEEALEFCNRVAILDHGKLLALDSPDQLCRQVSGDRYRIWTRDPAHAVFVVLAAQDKIRNLASSSPDPEGWTTLEMEIPGGAVGAAELNSFLVGEGVVISRFERIQLSLADLIERIQQHAAGRLHA